MTTQPSAPGRKALQFTIFIALAACAAFASTATSAATLLVDSFASPTPNSINSITGVGESSFNNSTASVLGGERGVYHHVYTNPLNNTATMTVGNGLLTSTTGAQAQTEVLVSYGAFTRPSGDPNVGGPLLGLNGTPYNAFHFDFTSVSTTLNINVVMYTANPLNPASPLYYSTVGVNVAPAVPGGPLSFDLPFLGTDPFNYAQVDGIVFLINRANDATGVSYTLDSFSLVSSVPEPGPLALWLAGISAMVWLRKTRR
jgi:hypothetical protein